MTGPLKDIVYPIRILGWDIGHLALSELFRRAIKASPSSLILPRQLRRDHRMIPLLTQPIRLGPIPFRTGFFDLLTNCPGFLKQSVGGELPNRSIIEHLLDHGTSLFFRKLGLLSCLKRIGQGLLMG